MLGNKQVFFDNWAPMYDCLFTTVFYQAVHQRLLEFVQLPVAATVLDLGCGTGKLLLRLARQNPTLQGTGLDFSAQMIHGATAQNQWPEQLQFLVGEASELPFPDHHFAAVFVTFSLMHYPEPHRTMREIYRVLQIKGCLYWVDFSLRHWSGWVPVSPQGIQLYSPDQREQLGAAVGLDCQHHNFLLGPVLLSRFAREV